MWAAARCRDKLGDYQQKLGKNRPLRQDNKTESECNMKTLAEARKRAGYTQKMMCEELDLDQSCIAHWEGGYREIPPYRLDQMLQIYGVHPNEIEIPALKDKRHQQKPQKPSIDTSKRADALRFALGQIVPKEHMEKVIEICAMIYEVERK